MITLSVELEQIYRPDLPLMQILCLKAAFKGTVLEEDTWVQTENGRVIGAVARNGGRLYLFTEKATDELKVFLDTVGFSEIFTAKETAQTLGLSIEKEYVCLRKSSVKNKDFSFSDIGLTSLYEGLKSGEDSDIVLPKFEDFAADISHRLRHGAAAAAVNDRGAALAFLCEKGAVINGISVKKELRGKGMGSKLLGELLSCLEGDVLACTGDKNTEFYIKNGFSEIGRVVIAR